MIPAPVRRDQFSRRQQHVVVHCKNL
jgi:hypothetical protein